MAALGYFDTSLCGACWFDPLVSEAAAWFDHDLVVCGEAAPPIVVEEEERGAWSEYRRRTKPRLVQLEPIWLEHEPQGGLEFGGAAYCTFHNARASIHRWVSPRGGLLASDGAAYIASAAAAGQYCVGHGAAPCAAGGAGVATGFQVDTTGREYTPKGTLGVLAGEAKIDQSARTALRLVA